MAETPSSGSGFGRAVVVVMILIGAALGTVAVLYWTKGVTEEPNDQAQSPCDEELANKEVAHLENEFGHAKERGQYDVILQKTRAFVARCPTYPDGYHLLAKIHIELYDWPTAYEHLQTCLKLDEFQPEVHRLAGTLQFRMGDLRTAEAHYRTAHELEPNDPRPLVYLAQVDIRRDQFTEAKVKLLEALGINNQSHEAYATMSDLSMHQNDPKRALQQIDKALRFAPTTERGLVIEYQLKRAAILRRDNDPEGALITLRENLFEHETMSPRVADSIATTFGMMGEPEKAASFFEQAADANPTEWRLVAGAADWRLKLGDYEMVRRHLRRLKRLDPNQKTVVDLQERLDAASKGAKVDAG